MREEKDPSTGMPVTLFTLQSIYAQNADEELLFQLNSGRMDMVVILPFSFALPFDLSSIQLPHWM
jgi:hypothetical protein